jgi:hypothetical protein
MKVKINHSYLAQYKDSQTSPIVDATFETLEELIDELSSIHKPGFELCFVFEDGERISNDRFIEIVTVMMIAYIKKDAAKRLEFYVDPGNTTDQLVDRVLYKKYGRSAVAEIDRKKDCTHKIERVKTSEDLLEVEISGLRAEINDNGSQVEVMGQIEMRGGSVCPDFLEIAVDAIDKKGRVLDTTATAKYFPQDLFPFATFKQTLTLDPSKVSKIRVYPKGL